MRSMLYNKRIIVRAADKANKFEGIEMNKLKLPRLISDGMVLQHGKKVCIWGEDEPGRQITLLFLGVEYSVETKENGEWQVYLQEQRPGGIFQMIIRDDAGNEKIVKDIVIGDVWLCVGQSNMELPMRSVIDNYPYELEVCENGCIRTFKIPERVDFHAPLKKHAGGKWKLADKRQIMDFSAVAYFFAKHFYQSTGIPVGMIDASLGGTGIEAWMGKDMLQGSRDLLTLADRYSNDKFVKDKVNRNMRRIEQWHEHLDSKDLGMREHWEQENLDISDWKDTAVPFFFKDTELKDFTGSVWFRKEFTVSGALAEKEAKLWLGTIVDSDTVYINGVLTGHTDLRYLSRKYTVPEGLLKEGKNVIAIRVKSEMGQGRFTDNKVYALFRGDERVDLTGEWKYRIGAACEKIPETEFVNRKPTGLYNGMIAPCLKYKIAGFLWYQGEANSRMPKRYRRLLKKIIVGYREKWGEELPFYFVQLPNFAPELYDLDRNGTSGDWAEIREIQRKALRLPNTAMAVTIDIGEDNDLHPVGKEGVGFRLAMLVLSKLYGEEMEAEGPQIYKVEMDKVPSAQNGGTPEWRVKLRFTSATDMHARNKNKDKDSEVTDFEFVDADGLLHQAHAEIQPGKIMLTCEDALETIQEVRYCYHNTNRGALIYNREGFPLTPFRYIIKREEAD